MLKLTTDKHDASRGLSVTAEFLVINKRHVKQDTKHAGGLQEWNSLRAYRNYPAW